tara:strand:- start:14 stop:238 length:225 start_codon:yes stop_codon:yes gene_type:complete
MSIEMEQLRIVRNKMLSESDWTQANDSPLSDSKKTEWKIYRQSLRDITKTAQPKISSEKFGLDKSSVTFPTKPS